MLLRDSFQQQRLQLQKCVIIRFKNKQLEARDNDCVIIMQ